MNNCTHQVIGHGSFGTVYYPALLVPPSKTSFQVTANMVSKVMGIEAAEHEDEMNKGLGLLDAIRPNFTVGYYGIYDIVLPTECNSTDFQPQYYKQLVYDYGGENLDDLNNMTFDNLFYNLDRLFDALVHLEIEDAVHGDIFSNNILFHPVTKQFSLIDFGSSQNMDELYTEKKNKSFPPEFTIYDKYSIIFNAPEKIKIANNDVAVALTKSPDQHVEIVKKAKRRFDLINADVQHSINALRNIDQLSFSYLNSISHILINKKSGFDDIFSKFYVEKRKSEINDAINLFKQELEAEEEAENSKKLKKLKEFGNNIANKCDVYMMGIVLLLVAFKLYHREIDPLDDDFKLKLKAFLELVHGMTNLNPGARLSPEKAKEAYQAFKQKFHQSVNQEENTNGGRSLIKTKPVKMKSASTLPKPTKTTKSKSKKAAVAVKEKETVDRKNNPKPTKTSEKVVVCKRERTVYKLGRRKFVRVKGSLVPLTDARKMKG